MSVFEILREQITLDQLISVNGSGKVRCIAQDHTDNDPSLHVYEDHVHCFACGFHGDVVDVWAAMHGFERPIEAALDLAREFRVELPELDPETRQRVQERRDKEGLYLRQARACHRALENHPRVREWWESRGFDEALQERFVLGTTRDGTAAVIPYWHRGRVQGLVRRRFEGEPKYLYPKAEEFAGGYRPLFIPGPARAGALLVEGIIDALACAALGESAIAVGGTGISAQQMAELERLPGPLYILPDADEEGAEAARRWVRELYPKALLCPADYREGKDAADLFTHRGGDAKEILEDLRAGATDALALELSEAAKGSDKLGAYRVAKERVLPLILKLEDEGERDAALRDVAARLGLGFRQLRNALIGMEETEAQKEEHPHQEPESEPLPKEAELLVSSPGVLDCYVEDVARIRGVVKDRDPLKLQTLVAVGAQLAPLPNGKPAGANLIITAEPSRGKNYICDAVSSALPEEFYLAFESASAKSLYYRAEDDPAVLKHRWIYPNEAEATDELVEMFRPLLSGGKASHLTVNKTSEGRNAAQELSIEGPASATIPTVRNRLDAQLQTRMLVAELADYDGRVAEHSRAVSRQLRPDRAGQDHTPKVKAWQAALRSLAAVRRTVFELDRKEFCFDSDQVSHGARLWGNLLGLMLAHAWLEQRNRDVVELASGERAIVATPEDYEVAYKVFKATCERSVVNLSDTHRKILTAVHVLKKEDDQADGFSQRKIADKAGVSVSTVSEHKTYLTKSVKLLRETDGGLTLVADAEPSWWEKGDLLVGFPRPEQVREWWEEEHRDHASETAEHAEHSVDTTRGSLGNAGNGVRYSAKQSPNTAEHTTNSSDASESVRQNVGSVRQPTEHENGLDKRESAQNENAFGLFGTSGEEKEKTSAGRRLTIEEAEEFKRLKSQGIPPDVARAEVLGMK